TVALALPHDHVVMPLVRWPQNNEPPKPLPSQILDQVLISMQTPTRARPARYQEARPYLSHIPAIALALPEHISVFAHSPAGGTQHHQPANPLAGYVH